MKDFLKKNGIIILAFALPIALIFSVAAYSYFPSLFLKTEYNFVYATCDPANDYYYRYDCDKYLQKLYSVNNNVIKINDINPLQDSDNDGVKDIDENYVTRLFFHDTSLNESKEITFEETLKLNLRNTITSPDGVAIESKWDRGGDFFLFFNGSSRYGHYLTKGSKSRKLNLINDDNSYYRRNFKFIGWVNE